MANLSIMTGKGGVNLSAIVGLLVAVIVVATVFIPIMGMFTESEATYTNDGVVFASVGSDGTVHTIQITTNDDNFVITTDGTETDFPTMRNYNPGGQMQSSAIAIGVYEGYVNSDNVLTSQAGVTPTASTSLTDFVIYANNGNEDNEYGTYRVWNFYDWTLYKIMAETVMGNFDSQYMFGAGATSGNASSTTGLTSTPYTASNSSSTSILLENSYGSLWEWVGDTTVNNYVLTAGNSRAGVSSASDVENVLTTTVTLPDAGSDNTTRYINTIYTASDVFGVPLTVGAAGTDGAAINDGLWDNTSTNRALGVGGSWHDSSHAGVSAFASYLAWSASGADVGSRLAYLIDDTSGSGVGATPDFAYAMYYGSDGTISDVKAMQNGVLTSVMPTGTTINDFWQFDTTTGIGPFGCYYVAINLADGDNTDDSTEARLSTAKGEIAYILNPANLKQTLAGNTFDSTLYNVMLVIPPVYWYSDTVNGVLYMASSSDAFDGFTLNAYAHTYTMDDDTLSSASLVVGEDSIVRIYSDGSVILITANGYTDLGTVTSDNTVTFTVTDDTLTYTPVGGSQTTQGNVMAYISSEGEWSMLLNPVVTANTEIIIGGYAHNLATDNDSAVDIGYCASGTWGEFSASSITATLYPVNDNSSTVSSTAITKNSTEVTSDLVKINSILFDTTWSDDGVSTATYSYFLAPSEVVYTNESYVDGISGTILSMLPVLVVLGLLLGVAAYLFSGRTESE